MQIFTWFPREGLQLSNDSNGHGLRPLILDVRLLIYSQCVTWPCLLSWPLSSMALCEF